MKRLAIFACPGPDAGRLDDGLTLMLLRAVRAQSNTTVLAAPATGGTSDHAALADELVVLPGSVTTTGGAYHHALERIGSLASSDWDEVLLVDAAQAGPLFPLDGVFAAMAARPCDFWALAAVDPARQKQARDPLPGGAFPRWGFMVLRRSVMDSGTLEKALNAAGTEIDVLRQQQAFCRTLQRAGLSFDTFIDMTRTRSADPALHEPWQLIEQRCPLVPLDLFTADPLLQDAEARDPRRFVELLRERTDFDTNLLWRYLLRTQRLRDLQTNLDLISVIPDIREAGARTAWPIGRVAVLIHLYYPEMIDDFLPRLAAIPVDYDLFITTASEESRSWLAQRLTGFGPGAAQVRVVEQNRGRDMAALFITLRDVVLSGKYELALRLHSKRSPQKASQVSDSFLEHLLDNLLPSRGFVANLFDQLADDPAIGLVIPPAVHIGFTSLGHAWFNNREATAGILQRLGLSAPLDEHTPVAPYGSMFWFRCAALKPLFAHDWSFADYNPEPHYLDGDLAHAQERAIAYVAQAQGFRTETVLSNRLAGRYYAKLEYKLQLLMSCLPTGTFARQYAAARDDKARRERRFSGQSLGEAVAQSSKDLRVRHPHLWQMTRPFARQVWPVIKRLLGHR